MKERYESKIAVYLLLTRITDGKTQILMQRRSNTRYMDGQYDMACSGHLEKGESISMAVVREAKEEIGIQISEKDLNLIGVIHPYKEDYLNFVFTTQKYEGEPHIIEKNKCDDLRWFEMDSIPENTMERVRNILINIQKQIMYDDGDFSHQKLM